MGTTLRKYSIQYFWDVLVREPNIFLLNGKYLDFISSVIFSNCFGLEKCLFFLGPLKNFDLFLFNFKTPAEKGFVLVVIFLN
jgi:hypothetical protein